MTPASPDSPTRAITGRYILALAIVGGLSLVAFGVLQWVIVAQETSAAVVNLSGRQRMLSQRTALFANQLLENPREQAHLRTTLIADLDLMERSHRALRDGDKDMGIPPTPPGVIRNVYHQVDSMVDYHLVSMRRLIAKPSFTVPDKAELEALTIHATGPLLEGLDRLVSLYQADSESDIRLLQWIEIGIVLTTLATLILEATVIFRPAVRRIVEERRKLVAAEAHTRLILENTHDAIVVVVNGVVSDANPAAGRLWRLTNESTLIGRRWQDLLASDDQAIDGYADSADLGQGEIRALTTANDDDTKTAVDASISNLPGNDHQSGIVILRQSTEELVRFAARLQRQNQELDQFASVTAHDMRAPLRAICNLSAWLEEDLGDTVDADSKEHLRLLRDRAARMERLIEGIRRMASIEREPIAPERLQLDRMVQEIFEEQVGSRGLKLQLNGELRPIVDDRTRVWQVFSNLIGNAIRHHDRDSGEVRISATALAGQLTMAISDDGPGIPEEHHERVFGMFKTLKPKDETGSIGLGLALVRKIVNERGGTIWIEPGEGRGTTFHLTWPCTYSEQETATNDA